MQRRKEQEEANYEADRKKRGTEKSERNRLPKQVTEATPCRMAGLYGNQRFSYNTFDASQDAISPDWTQIQEVGCNKH